MKAVSTASRFFPSQAAMPSGPKEEDHLFGAALAIPPLSLGYGAKPKMKNGHFLKNAHSYLLLPEKAKHAMLRNMHSRMEKI